MLKNYFYQCSSILLKNIKIRKEDAPIMRAGGYNDDNDCVHGQSKQRITRITDQPCGRAMRVCPQPYACGRTQRSRARTLTAMDGEKKYTEYCIQAVESRERASVAARGKIQRSLVRTFIERPFK